MFDELDKDGNGKLDASELKAFLQKMRVNEGKITEAQKLVDENPAIEPLQKTIDLWGT